MACTKVEEHYYYTYCSKFDKQNSRCIEWVTCEKFKTTGECEEWITTDNDPFVENDVVNDDDGLEQDTDFSEEETNDFVYEDFDEIPEENPEPDEEKDDVVPDNDVDIPENVCIYLQSSNILGKCFEAEDGEKIFISDKKEPTRCKAIVESSTQINRYYYGIEFPFYTEDGNSTLDYNQITEKVIIDEKEFTLSTC